MVIENLLKIQDAVQLKQLRIFLENLVAQQDDNIQPMSPDTFYSKIEASEKALENGETITQENLREEVLTWKKNKRDYMDPSRQRRFARNI